MANQTGFKQAYNQEKHGVTALRTNSDYHAMPNARQTVKANRKSAGQDTPAKDMVA